MKNRKNKAILIGILALAIGLGPGGFSKVLAEKSEEEISDEMNSHRDSIVRVETICGDGEAAVYETKECSGFVASEDATGIYIVTVCDSLAYTTKEKETIRTKYGLEENDRLSETIEVIFDGDVRVPASIVGESDQRNLAVLKLNQTIKFENDLVFAKKDALKEERVFLLSYPETENRKKAVYSSENVLVTSGLITKIYKKNENIFFNHDIKTDGASVGGLLLNQDGFAVGLLLTPDDKKAGTAIGSGEIKSFLNTFNISYQEEQEVKTEKKLPVLNIILGIIIAGLLLLVIIQQIKTGKGQEQHKKKNGRNSKKREAGLEYPAGRRYVIIQKSPFVIGRTKEADLDLLENKGISRKHACILYDGSGFYLMDLQSTNHTFLNGTELKINEKRRLKDRDEIMLGKVKLIFRCN